MKQKINLSILISLIAGLLFNACTNAFDAINTNPDRTTTAEPEYIFGLTTVAAFRAISGNLTVGDVNGPNWYIFGNYGNQWSVVGGTGPHFGADSHSDGIWNTLYTGAILPCNNIVRDYGDNPAYTNRVAIAKIWRSYCFSQLVGLYGPCPYTNAANGESSTPYDKEETIYRGILQELKDAYTSLDPKGDTYPTAAEPFLASDINRWSQFAHCIRLRTAARLTEVPDQWASGLANDAKAIVVEELNNAENGQLITNNSGNFYMAFGSDQTANQNPVYREVVANPQLANLDPGQFPVIHESLVLWMGPNSYNDPCLNVYMTAGSGGTRAHPLPPYLGRPHSMDMPQNYHSQPGWSSPYNGLKYADFATIGKMFSGMIANFYFFSYPELCFLRSEAVLKGYWGGSKTAEQYYYDGIEARCSKYGVSGTAVANYENSPGIHWSTPSDTTKNPTAFRDYLGGIINSYLGGEEDNFKRIIVQHWISLFSQNIDIYTLLRRTEVIPFKPHFGSDPTSANVTSTYAFMPERLIYPGNELNINTKETQYAISNYLLDNTLNQQPDQVSFRLIYAKDNPGLPAPEDGSIAYAAYPFPLPNMAKNRQ